MKIAKRFEVYRDVTSDPRVKLKPIWYKGEKPLMVALVLDLNRVLAGEIEHHKSVFIDDRFHDWDYNEKTDELRYYAHSLGSAIMAESCGDEVERGMIVAIYEFQE